MAANFFSSLFGGGQSTAAAELQAKQKQLEAQLAAVRGQNAQLTQLLRGGTPAEQAEAVSRITGGRERASADLAVETVTKNQPNYNAQNERTIARNRAAQQDRADAETQVIGAQGSNAMNLLKQFQTGETAARNWVTGEGNNLIGSLDQSYLTRMDAKMGLLDKAQKINSQITPRDLLGMVGPLAGLALAFS